MAQISKQPAPNAAAQGEIKTNPASASKSRGKQQFTTATTAGSAGLSERHQAILEARGISLELAATMGWRTAQDGCGVEIPFTRQGKEVNTKYRTIEGEKRFHQVAGGEKCLYNVDALAELGDAPLVITEGEMDCMIALHCGYVAVSVPDGAPKEEIGDRETVKYDYLRDIPKTIKRIILATDGDRPGVNLMNDLALRLGKHRCQWVRYPKGCKDLNEAFLAYGRKGVDAVMATAQFIKVSGLYSLSELPPLVENFSFDVGIQALGDNLRLRKGDFSVFTGIPSHGKSTFVNHLVFNMIEKHGWKACFASFEQHPQTEHRRAFVNLLNGRPINEQTEAEISSGVDWINKHISFIVPSDEGTEWFDMTWLLDCMAAAVTQRQADIIVIDPWNEIDHVYDQRQTSLTQYVGASIKTLKRFAKDYNVHVLVVAHPAKMRKGGDGKFPVPTAYDISDSSHWYNKPDQVVVVHREDEGTLIRVAKSRYHYALGKPGDVNVRFNTYTLKFS